ncbi:MAG: AIR synthase-related protein [Promethearchaeota archaeon]
MPSSERYEALGVSSGKEDVHAALKNVDKGLYGDTFCKVLEDLAGDPEHCVALHADTAGTKGSLAYLYYREFGDVDVFRGVVQDAVVMNTDDLLCAGLPEKMYLSNTLGRNKNLIPGTVVSTVIDEYERFAGVLRGFRLPVVTCGGETADVGDIVRTIDLGVTIVARYSRSNIVRMSSVRAGDVIVGLASYGKANYEDEYNSGIGSNGLTLAKHGTFRHHYAEKYPEIYDPALPEELVFFGKYDLDDPLPGTPLTMGRAVLSPTRTYAPVLCDLYKKVPLDGIHAVFHNTGGGQTKCLGFGRGIHYVKDDPLPVPPVFGAIQESSSTPWAEMYQVFNMGARLEVVCTRKVSEEVIKTAAKHGVDAKVVGHCARAPSGAASGRNLLTLDTQFGSFKYEK